MVINVYNKTGSIEPKFYRIYPNGYKVVALLLDGRKVDAYLSDGNVYLR